jgi:bifunctional DNase/RNase
MKAYRRSAIGCGSTALLAISLLLGCSMHSGKGTPTARPMRVDSVKFDPHSDNFVLLLTERGGEGRELLILIGENEAASIARGIDEIKLPRPNTHDLIKNLLTGMDGHIERVVVTELKNSTFYAVIDVEIRGRKVSIDARPSDAIAIAVRTGTTVYAEEAVLRSARDLPESGPAREIDWRPVSF